MPDTRLNLYPFIRLKDRLFFSWPYQLRASEKGFQFGRPDQNGPVLDNDPRDGIQSR